MSTTTPSILFNPSAEDAERLLTLMNDEAYSLADIASGANTSIEALTCWLARPDIAQRLSNLESAAARRTRLVAGNRMMFVVTTLARILEEYNEDEYKNPYQHGPHGHELKRRAHETARKAAALLYRLSRYHPASTPPTARTQRPASAAPGNADPARRIIHCILFRRIPNPPNSPSSTNPSSQTSPPSSPRARPPPKSNPPSPPNPLRPPQASTLTPAALSHRTEPSADPAPAPSPSPHPHPELFPRRSAPPQPPSPPRSGLAELTELSRSTSKLRSLHPEPPDPRFTRESLLAFKNWRPYPPGSGYGASYANYPPGQKAPPEPNPRPP